MNLHASLHIMHLICLLVSFEGANATLQVLGLIRHFKQVLFYSNGQFDYRPMF